MEFWAISKTWPIWINLITFTFINEKNKYSRGLHKTWSKFISLDMKKNKIKHKF